MYPQIVERQEAKAYAFLAFLRYPKPIRRSLYPGEACFRPQRA